MSFRWSYLGSAAIAVLSTTAAVGASPAMRVRPLAATAAIGAPTRAVLDEAVKRNLAGIDLGAAGRSYSVRPSLVQLRQYVEAGARPPKLVCIVDLALEDDHGALVGSVRGRATATNATPKDAIDAASHSAVTRLPEVLRMAERAKERSGEIAKR